MHYIFDWKSQEGKELLQKVFKRLLSYEDWARAAGQEVTQWRFIRAFCRERKKPFRLIEDAIQYLVDCRLVVRETRVHNNDVIEMIQTSTFGRNRWEAHQKKGSGTAKQVAQQPAKVEQVTEAKQVTEVKQEAPVLIPQITALVPVEEKCTLPVLYVPSVPKVAPKPKKLIPVSPVKHEAPKLPFMNLVARRHIS